MLRADAAGWFLSWKWVLEQNFETAGAVEVIAARTSERLGAPGRGLVRLRFDQRRKRGGPILSRSSLGHHCDVLCALTLNSSPALFLQFPLTPPPPSALFTLLAQYSPP